MLNRDQIKEIIPHREPLLLVDEVTEVEPGRRAVGLLHVRPDAFWVPGHFPGNPILPGVLQVEAIAQTGAVALMQMPAYAGKVPLFAGLENVRFRRPVRPGEILRMEVEIVKLRGPVGRGAGRAYVGDELACECELIFAFADPDKVR